MQGTKYWLTGQLLEAAGHDKTVHCLSWLQEGLQLNASYLDSTVLGTVNDQHDSESLHTRLHEAMEDQHGGQLLAHCTSHHQVQRMTRGCSFPTVVLHRLETLSQVIGKTGYRYWLCNGVTIYVDESKTSTQWSTSPGQQWKLERLNKCLWMVTTRGKVVRNEGVRLPEGNTEDSYK